MWATKKTHTHLLASASLGMSVCPFSCRTLKFRVPQSFSDMATLHILNQSGVHPFVRKVKQSGTTGERPHAAQVAVQPQAGSHRSEQFLVARGFNFQPAGFLSDSRFPIFEDFRLVCACFAFGFSGVSCWILAVLLFAFA